VESGKLKSVSKRKAMTPVLMKGPSPLSAHIRDQISSLLAETLLADLQAHSDITVVSPPRIDRKLKLTPSGETE
jgi:hypothetical protein